MFDLDAARAARREAEGTGFTFTFGGEQYETPPAKEWPINVIASLSEGNLIEALRLILNDDYDRFMAHNPTNGDVEDLMTAMSANVGVGGLGNS